MSVRLALPSKGRLQAQCVDWLAARGLTVERSGEDREYAGHIHGVEGIELTLMSASEIAKALSDGRVHLGVTGADLVRETVPGWEEKVTLLTPLGFGRADLVIAVPAAWVDVETVHDLDAAAAAFRAAHGRRLRIATKYHNLARSFLERCGVADYALIDSQGATEAAPLHQTAEAIIDITSSGETLRANHLRILEDGLILASEAYMCQSTAAPVEGEDITAMAALLERIGGG